MLPLLLAATGVIAAASQRPAAAADQVFSVFSFGARGDGRHNDTAAVQAAMNAAAKAGGGVAWLPANGTYLFGGGVYAYGHSFDGVTLQIDGTVTVPMPAPNKAAGVWPQCAPGWGGSPNGTLPACYMIMLYNVAGFTLTSSAGPALMTGFLCDPHDHHHHLRSPDPIMCRAVQCPIPGSKSNLDAVSLHCTDDEHKDPRPPAGMSVLNCTHFLWENVRFQHVSGAAKLWAAPLICCIPFPL